MKIVQVYPRFPSTPYGGAENHVYCLSKYLARNGFEVTVVSSRIEKSIPLWGIGKGRAKPFEELDGFSIKRFPASIVAKGYSIVPQLLKGLLEEKPDIIHAHGYHSFTSDMSALASRVGNVPFVITIHGLELRNLVYDRTLGEFTLRTAKKIIGVSNADIHPLTERRIVPKEKIEIIPNGVDFDFILQDSNGLEFRKRNGIANDENLVLFVGRLAGNKGLEFLIQAIPTVLEKNPNTRFVLVGEDWGMKQQLVQQARSIGVANRIVFTGLISPRFLQEAYEAADVFVLPSLFEAFGIVLIEALAHSKPVVATRVGGVPEVIRDNETGILVDVKKPHQLACSINRLLNDPEFSRKLGKQGKLVVGQKFNWNMLVKKTIKVYNAVLSAS